MHGDAKQTGETLFKSLCCRRDRRRDLRLKSKSHHRAFKSI